MLLLQKIKTHLRIPWWLFAVLLGVFILRIPTFFEPYYYGDEMIYIVLGQGLRRGLSFYADVHDNKPPLLYLLAGIAGNLFWFKAILALWSLITIYIFWKFADRLFPKKNLLHKVSVGIFALLTTLPLLEGNIVNSEILMIGPTILAFYLGINKKLTPKKIFAAGLLFSIATLLKVPAAFDIPALIVFWILREKITFKNIKIILIRSLFLGSGFLLPIALSFLWYFSQGILREYVTAAFMQNVGYLSSWRPAEVQEPFLVRNSPLLVRGGILALLLFLLVIKRTKLTKQFLLLTIWLFFSAFAVTLSERPYPHYLLQLVPTISLLLGMLFTLQTIEQVLVILPLTLIFYIPIHYRFWYYKSLPYYQRFINFSIGKIDKETYIASFGGNTALHYKLAQYVTTSTTRDDKVFVWGDSSAIYALSDRLPPGRYIADYHLRDFSNEAEIISSLTKKHPKLIIVMPQMETFQELKTVLTTEYRLINEIEGADIYELVLKAG